MQYEPQTPAQGVMITNDFEDVIFYRVACNCGSEDHDITLEIEYEEDLKAVTVRMYQETTTAYWARPIKVDMLHWSRPLVDVANAVINRFTLLYSVIIKGVIKREAYLILNKQEAVNLAGSITTGIEYVTANGVKKATKQAVQQSPKLQTTLRVPRPAQANPQPRVIRAADESTKNQTTKKPRKPYKNTQKKSTTP